jgi:hypothetical protein
MSTGKLILHSDWTQPSILEAELLADALRDTGLIGEPLAKDKELFLAGKHFLQLISFVGCSTNVCLTPKPGDAGNFCNIAITGPLRQPTLIWDRNRRPPRCPACETPMTNWQEQIHPGKLTCSQCNKELQLQEISWGRQAGYGRIFIEISNIFPGEARPTHILLAELSRTTSTEWSYFYIESEKVTLERSV